MNMKDVIVPASVALATLSLPPAASAQEQLTTTRDSLVRQSSASHLEAGPMSALRLSGAISASTGGLGAIQSGATLTS